MKTRAGLIGVSGYGRVHLTLAQEAAERGELSLDAAVVINPQEEAVTVRALTGAGCRIYPNHEEMLRAEAGRLDLCLIPTGIAWHARMASAAMRAGLDVLVEKPLAGSSKEGREICAVAAETGRLLAVGFQDLYEPDVHRLKRLLVAGGIGRVRSVRFLGLWPRPLSYYTRNNWAGRLTIAGAPVYDSPLSNAFAHFVMLGLFFAAPTFADAAIVTKVEATLWRTNEIESFDTGVVRAMTESGVQVWFGASHACAANREPEIIIEGDAGRVTWRHAQECVIERSGHPTEQRALRGPNDARREMMAAVLRRRSEPATFICTPEMALSHTVLIEALHQAAPITAAPGEVVARILPGLTEPVLAVGEIESVLFQAFERQSLPSPPTAQFASFSS